MVSGAVETMVVNCFSDPVASEIEVLCSANKDALLSICVHRSGARLWFKNENPV